jgi:PPK2 family polyphosphate:nucleotide phosphotransferase
MEQAIHEKLLRRLIVPEGKKISLAKDYPPSGKLVRMPNAEARARLTEGVNRLAEFHDKLCAQRTYGLVVIFQTMDEEAKDGAIRHVMSYLNPRGIQLIGFNSSSAGELNHDYLWRGFRALPERGLIGIFNRSYYEDVQVVRAHREPLEVQKLAGAEPGTELRERRFEEINNFELYLTGKGIIPLKFYLNLSKGQQRRGFLDYGGRPERNWKPSAGDARELGHWDEYTSAYEECLRRTSTKWAPWHVIPADDKQLARLVVALVIWNRLKQLGLEYPSVSEEQNRGWRTSRFWTAKRNRGGRR